MADVTKVATEVVEAVAAPVATVAMTEVASGELNYKKVALIAGGTVVVIGLGGLGYMAYKKHRAKKEAELTTACEETPWETPEAKK